MGEVRLPEIEVLEAEFSFVSDKTLRQNLAINLQYIIFLTSYEESNDLSGPLSYSIFKNIILYAASIVEGVLHYALKRLIEMEKIDENKVMPFFIEKWQEVKVLHKIDPHLSVCGGLRTKKKEELKGDTQFLTLIRAAFKAGIITDSLRDRIDNLRKLRNRIHLAGLQYVDNTYDKSDIEVQFLVMSHVIDVAGKKLSE